jgi:hypothetical protein
MHKAVEMRVVEIFHKRDIFERTLPVDIANLKHQSVQLVVIPYRITSFPIYRYAVFRYTLDLKCYPSSCRRVYKHSRRGSRQVARSFGAFRARPSYLVLRLFWRCSIW